MSFDRSALGATGYSVSVDGPLEDGGDTSIEGDSAR